jgi:small subunit ribosomal protein S8
MSPIANMLTQIKNAQSRGKEEVVLPFSKMTLGIAEILKNKGFVGSVEKKIRKMKKSEIGILGVELKYENGVGAISNIKLISKPSRRVYAGKDDLRPVRNGYGISIISTPKGLMTGDEARKMGIGGEIICEVW